MTVRRARAVRPPRPITLPRSSGCTRTSRTRPRRRPWLFTRTSSGWSTMPFTRCSRASSSTSRLAVLLAARGRYFLGGALLGGGPAGPGRLAVLSGGGALGGGVLSLGGGAVLGGLGVVGALSGLACARALAVRLGRLAGNRLGVLRLGGVGALRLRGVRLGSGLAAPGLVRLGLGRLERLGDRRGKGFLLVRPGLSGLQRALAPGQALELLPVTGDLKDPPDRVRGLCPHREPVLGPVRVDLDERGLRLGVVLADLLDRPAVPLGTGVGDDDPVKGRTDLPHALELDLDSHGCGLLP